MTYFCSSITLLFSLVIHASTTRNIFNSHHSITDEFIQKINDIQDSWTAGHNFLPGTKFSDLKILMGTVRNKIPQEKIKYIDFNPNEKIPKTFDARKKWPKCNSIKDIKNQGHCGSCWAVSSAATMSDRLCIATNGKFNTDISAQEVTSCTPGMYGCHGGWPSSAWQYFVDHGVSTGGSYKSKKGCQPYLVKPCINRTANFIGEYQPEEDGHPEQCPDSDYVGTPACRYKCSNPSYHKNYRKDLHKGKNVIAVPKDVKQIQLHIMRYGPVVADFTVYTDFMTYKSGIYQHTTSSVLGGHAIRILGWGEENGKDYWIIANQWGKEWGSNGTVKFLRGKNECGIEEDVVSGIV